MALAVKLKPKGLPLIIYKTDIDNRPILDSVAVVGVSQADVENVRLYAQGDDYKFLRGELLTQERFDPAKTRLSVSEANRLREFLCDVYSVKGLKGELH